MPGGHDTTIEVSNIMSFVLYTQILKKSVLKPASPGITLMVYFVNIGSIVFHVRILICVCIIFSLLHCCCQLKVKLLRESFMNTTIELGSRRHYNQYKNIQYQEDTLQCNCQFYNTNEKNKLQSKQEIIQYK